MSIRLKYKVVFSSKRPLFYLFTLLYPALNNIAGVANLLIDVVLPDIDMNPGKAPGILDTLSRLEMGISYGGESALVLP